MLFVFINRIVLFRFYIVSMLKLIIPNRWNFLLHILFNIIISTNARKEKIKRIKLLLKYIFFLFGTTDINNVSTTEIEIQILC